MSKIIDFGAPKPPQQKTLSIDDTNSSDVLCKNCEGVLFLPAAAFKRVSKFAIAQDKDAYVPIDVFVCAKCGHVLEELLPDAVKRQPEPETPIVDAPVDSE